MTSEQVTALTNAFKPDSLVAGYILLAPYILTVAGVVVAIQLIKWGVRLIRRRLSGGVA